MQTKPHTKVSEILATDLIGMVSEAIDTFVIVCPAVRVTFVDVPMAECPRGFAASVPSNRGKLAIDALHRIV